MHFARLWLLAVWLFPIAAIAGGPADELFRLVPPEAGVTLAIEDLRGHSRAILASPLAEGLGKLPAVRAWLAANGPEPLRKARRDIETALGVDLATIRDDLLGDAVVFALLAPTPEAPDQPRGLVLVKYRDRKLIDRLIAASIADERRGGALVDVQARRWKDQDYSLRDFRPGTKPDDAYAILPGDVFVWSNSERLVREAIERRGGREGLDVSKRFRRVRAELPASSVASLFVDPAFVRSLAGDDLGAKPDDRAAALLGRYLGAVDYAGLALEWRDGPVLHLHQLLDPGKLDAPWTRLAERAGSTRPLVRRVPASAFGLAVAHADPGAILDLIREITPPADRPRFDNLLEVVQGVLLGRDLRTDILPALGPGWLAYVDRPAAGGTAPLVVLVGVGGDSGVPVALTNGLRTLLALASLDPKRGTPAPKVETRQIDGVAVTMLGGKGTPIAFALGEGVLAIGNEPAAVARPCARGAADEGGAELRAMRARFFADAETFAFVDLGAARRWAVAHRAALAQRLDANRADDLDHVLALLGLFRALYFTSETAADFSQAHHRLGLIQQDEKSD